MQQVRKRNGKFVNYEAKKIYECIRKADADTKTSKHMKKSQIYDVIEQIEEFFNDVKAPTVEKIQDVVETKLIENGYINVAKSYMGYRQMHAKMRDAHEDLMTQIRDIIFSSGEEMDHKRQNANIASDTTMGNMLICGTTLTNYLNDNYIIPKEYIDYHRAGYIHIHDKDFSNLTWNCIQIDLPNLLTRNFSTGHGSIRPIKSIRSAASIACVVIQANQNEQFGGQSIATFDYAMAIGIRETFKKEFKSALRNVLDCYDYSATDIEDILKAISVEEYPTYNIKDNLLPLSQKYNIDIKILDKAFVHACKRTEVETKQAMEGCLFNFNTLHSRSGAQVPFSSLNFGTDTSEEGRLATKHILLAQFAGLGRGEVSIFPITVFKLKKGVNYNPEDPNYDLFQLAMKVSAKRLYPNFVSIDSSFNLPYYKEGDPRTEIATMGCRTRTIGNINGPEIVTSRGNFSFTTINLPLLAIEANRDIKKFYKSLDKMMDLCKRQLLWRFEQISQRHAYNYPFLVQQGVWLGGEKLKPNDTVGELLKQASISIGYCGLAEALVALIGTHHGESEEAQKLGLEIITHMRKVTDKYAEETHLNFSLFASPAESTAGRFLKLTKKKHGVIKGVTDREYFTNSNHVPVYYHISAVKKCQIEGPYHALANAGAISYLEFEGDPSKNLPAFEKLVRLMHDSDMGYFSINSKKDICPNCKEVTIIDGHTCPICGYSEIYNNEKMQMFLPPCDC